MHGVGSYHAAAVHWKGCFACRSGLKLSTCICIDVLQMHLQVLRAVPAAAPQLLKIAGSIAASAASRVRVRPESLALFFFLCPALLLV